MQYELVLNFLEITLIAKLYKMVTLRLIIAIIESIFVSS